mmetsp:Transcript_10462/g.33826  ORF Transcript_10462/g.33826 Transcript_10462/m.33826 type:complete len:214 (+) Transcript_10462:296-937(+)
MGEVHVIGGLGGPMPAEVHGHHPVFVLEPLRHQAPREARVPTPVQAEDHRCTSRPRLVKPKLVPAVQNDVPRLVEVSFPPDGRKPGLPPWRADRRGRGHPPTSGPGDERRASARAPPRVGERVRGSGHHARRQAHATRAVHERLAEKRALPAPPRGTPGGSAPTWKHAFLHSALHWLALGGGRNPDRRLAQLGARIPLSMIRGFRVSGLGLRA